MHYFTDPIFALLLALVLTTFTLASLQQPVTCTQVDPKLIASTALDDRTGDLSKDTIRYKFFYNSRKYGNFKAYFIDNLRPQDSRTSTMVLVNEKAKAYTRLDYIIFGIKFFNQDERVYYWLNRDDSCSLKMDYVYSQIESVVGYFPAPWWSKAGIRNGNGGGIGGGSSDG